MNTKILVFRNRIQRQMQIDLSYLLKGGFWLTFGQIIASASSLIVTATFANYVDPQTFGTYKYVIAVSGLLTIPTLKGINMSYTQAVARGYEGDYSKIIRVRLLWGFAGTFFSLILASYYFFQNNLELGTAFLILSFFIPFYETLSLYINLLTGTKKFKLAAKYFTISRIVPLPILLIAIYFTGNIIMILLSYFLPITIIHYLLGKYVTKIYKPNTLTDAKVISYGKHLSFVGAFGGSIRYFDSLILFVFIDAPSLAIYALATAPVDQISAQYKSLSSLVMLKLSKKAGIEIHQTFWRRLIYVTLLSTGMTIAYFFITPLLFKLIFPLYPESIIYAQSLGVVLFMGLINSFLGGIIQSRLDITPKKLLYWRISPRIIFIGSLFVLVPQYGILGAVISRIVLSISITLYQFIQYYLVRNIQRD